MEYETPEEYEKALVELKEKIEAFSLETGDFKELENDAYLVMKQRDKFPDVYARYSDIEGLMCDIISQRTRTDTFRNLWGPVK